jgi:hypothetical protein
LQKKATNVNPKPRQLSRFDPYRFVIGAGSDDLAELWMRPSDAIDGSGMSAAGWGAFPFVFFGPLPGIC